jgi:hypothetical protein
LAQAILTADYLEILLAQRREIVESLPDVRGPAIAALHRQITLLSREIADVQAARADADSVIAQSSDEPWSPSTRAR